MGVIEKLWIKAWGEHYNVQGSSSITASSYFSAYGTDAPGYPSHDIMSTDSWKGVFSTRGIIPDLPSAQKHPLFYVSVYAGIGVAASLISTSNSIVQYFGSYKYVAAECQSTYQS